jgi:hypothetical protein
LKTTRTEVTKCPSCGYAIDAHSSMTDDEAVPRPEDVSVCLRCLCYMQFDADLRLRLLTPAEFLALPDEIRAYLIQARIAGWKIDTRAKVDEASASRRRPRSP